MSELTRRWLVASIAIPVVLVLAYLGGWFLTLPLAGLAGWSAFECYRLASYRDIAPLVAIGSATAAGLVLAAGWRPTFIDFAPIALGIVGVSVMTTLVAAMLTRGPTQKPLTVVSVTVFGALYPGLSLAFAPLLHRLPTVRGWEDGLSSGWSGLLVLSLPLAATWVGDAAALFAGTAWGKAKLAPTISPNKSWVGFWADVLGAAGAVVIWAMVAEPILPVLPLRGLPLVAFVGAILGLAAVTGDLVESLLKREAGVKDSGTFFPGHGGVIDRIDSLMFTIPTAYCVLALLGVAR